MIFKHLTGLSLIAYSCKEPTCNELNIIGFINQVKKENIKIDKNKYKAYIFDRCRKCKGRNKLSYQLTSGRQRPRYLSWVSIYFKLARFLPNTVAHWLILPTFWLEKRVRI